MARSPAALDDFIVPLIVSSEMGLSIDLKNASAVLCVVPALVLNALACGSATAQAGFPGGRTGPVTFDSVIEVKGELTAAQGNYLKVTRDDGEEVTVMLHEDPTRLTYTAEAIPAYLRPRMMVRTSLTLGANRMPIGPAEKVEVFQPLKMPRMPAQLREKFAPGIHSTTRTPNPAAAAGRFVPGRYSVVGMVMGMDGQGVYVNTGQGRMLIPFSPETKLTVAYNNLSLAKPGDSVSVSGFHQPPDESKVVADRVTIRTDRVMGEADENAGGRVARGRGRGRAPAADPVPPAEADAAAEANAAETPDADAANADAETPPDGLSLGDELP